MRLGDLFTFLSVHRSSSVTGAARELRVTPSQVSKAISRLEEQLNVRLLSRGSRGVTLSEEGRRLLPFVEDAVSRLRLLGREGAKGTDLTVAAPSWLIHNFLPAIAASMPELRVRGLELPPPLLRAYAAENFYDVTMVTSDVERFPGAWVSTRVGDLDYALFATPATAARLGPTPVDPSRVRAVPMVTPIFNLNGQFIPVDDDCPLPHSQRNVGHEAQTIGTALELAALTGQIVFGPKVAARRFVRGGVLVDVPVEGWNVTEPLYLVSNSDRVLSRIEKGILRSLRDALHDLDGKPAPLAE